MQTFKDFITEANNAGSQKYTNDDKLRVNTPGQNRHGWRVHEIISVNTKKQNHLYSVSLIVPETGKVKGKFTYFEDELEKVPEVKDGGNS